jgi:hypothetical protein
MVFSVVVGPNVTRDFSLDEYLAWRESLGFPIPEKEIASLIMWLNAEDNNLGRVGCWLSVLEFRHSHPEHPSVKEFARKTAERQEREH